jgi:hypothetical protein
MAEGGSLHLDNLRIRAGDFDTATRDRLLAGALLPAHWVHRAQRLAERGGRRPSPPLPMPTSCSPRPRPATRSRWARR